MKNKLKEKTVLVTGGTGSIGSEIVRQLLKYDINKAVIFSRDEIKHFMAKKRINDDRLETVVGDIRDFRSINRVFELFDIDLIYHASAMKHVVMCENFPLESVKTNIIGTQNIVDLAKINGSELITISTDKSVHPINVMGATKFIAERITLNAGYSCVRFGNVANSRGSVIPVFIDNLIHNKPLEISDPNVTRFVIETSEAIKLVLQATQYSAGSDIFILKMRAFRLGDLIDVIVDRVAPKLNLSKHDIKFKVNGLLPGESLHEELINHAEFDKTYELKDMYVVLQNNKNAEKYHNLKKVNLHDYNSKNVELISKDEIEDLVNKYMGNIKIG